VTVRAASTMVMPSLPFLKRLRGGAAVPRRSDGVGRSGLNRPANHPSGTVHAAPYLMCPELRSTGCGRYDVHLISSQTGGSGAPETSDDQPWRGGPSRELHNIIGVLGHPPFGQA